MPHNPSSPSRVLALIPSFVKKDIEASVAADQHPRMDYHELTRTLRARGAKVDVLDYSSVPMRRLKMLDQRMALMAFAMTSRYDAIFCNSESIALPLGALLRRRRNRPRVIGIGHRISTPKKEAFFTRFGAMDGIDTLFLYATAQRQHAVDHLGISPEKAPLIMFHADTKFFRPIESISEQERPRLQVCAAGLEWRDYPTLLAVAAKMPEVDFHLAAASPWSKHRDETADHSIPSNVTVQRHGYDSLRTLYLTSDITVAPLYETDFQAGVTSILEAMACGRPVVVSKTQGQTDVIVDEVNGLYVRPGDAESLDATLRRLLKDPKLREKIGTAGRAWVEANASLELWAETIADSILAI